jgi:hypothetical protein
MHVERVVWACLGTCLAGDATTIVEIDDAIGSGVERGDRTDLDARSIGAVVAPHYGKESARVWEFTFFDVFDPSAVHADGNFVFGLARDCASVASDAFAIIDYEAVIHGT